MGLIQNYKGLVVSRVFLGISELSSPRHQPPFLLNSGRTLADQIQAGFFPAASYILTCWYPPHEVQLRIGYFYGAGALSGALSGLLAFAIEKMQGVGGLAGWRW